MERCSGDDVYMTSQLKRPIVSSLAAEPSRQANDEGKQYQQANNKRYTFLSQGSKRKSFRTEGTSMMSFLKS
ncbi:hypothetical protein HAX54_039938 [Datura stramonium]|uniref:Uncharacterized protein n=1 Tax=Datura stramonium TaxID=4076 RepID=A0ABS8VNK4_DATST|nr:hypothetical protein [Datura stramonium]